MAEGKIPKFEIRVDRPEACLRQGVPVNPGLIPDPGCSAKECGNSLMGKGLGKHSFWKSAEETRRAIWSPCIVLRK
jgi:hypothetical protein